MLKKINLLASAFLSTLLLSKWFSWDKISLFFFQNSSCSGITSPSAWHWTAAVEVGEITNKNCWPHCRM